MPTIKITLTFTLAQALALDRAAGQTTSMPDAMEATYPTKRERDVAYRAHQKLADAIVNAGGYSAARTTDWR